MIPSSILTYVAGASILSNKIEDNEGMRIFIGFSSIASGVLTNLMGTLKFKELAERHRTFRDSFNEYFREISSELALEPCYRQDAIDFMKQKKALFDQLIKQSPDIPSRCIREFNRRFDGVKCVRPDITNGIHTIKTFEPKKSLHAVPVTIMGGSEEGSSVDSRGSQSSTSTISLSSIPIPVTQHVPLRPQYSPYIKSQPSTTPRSMVLQATQVEIEPLELP
jgi:hypothetical protein